MAGITYMTTSNANFMPYEGRPGSFVKYNNPYELRDINQNDLKITNDPIPREIDQISTFPYNIYTHQPLQTAWYLCSSKRNTAANYVLGEINDLDDDGNPIVNKHPERFTRYNQNNGCFFPYKQGVQSGRNYNLPCNCEQKYIPPNFAPERLYPYGNDITNSPSLPSVGYLLEQTTKRNLSRI